MVDITDGWIADALRGAYRVALESPDPSTQCGSVLFDKDLNFVSSGSNTFTKGVESTPERLERPLKYSYVEHAERNSIYAAVQLGAEPHVMVAPWAACTECARAIVQSGIKVLVRHKQASDRSPERWIESINFADTILRDGGVEIIDFNGSLNAVEIWHCEERWTP